MPEINESTPHKTDSVPCIEISLDKKAYHTFKVDDDGEIYPQRIVTREVPELPVVRNEPPIVHNELKTPARVFPEIDDNGIFKDRLVSGERILWYEHAHPPLRKIAAVCAAAVSLSFIFMLCIGAPLVQTLLLNLALAVLGGSMGYSFSNIYYAVTNNRIMIRKCSPEGKFSVTDIPLEHISSFKIKRRKYPKANVKFNLKTMQQYSEDSFVNISLAFELSELLKEYGIKEKDDG